MAPQIVRALTIAVALGVLAGGLHPRSAFADDAARISRLESEIQQLRTRIDEQHRRILRLEDELERRKADPGAGKMPDRSTKGITTGESGPLPWHAPASWARVAEGMTEAQVTEILGPPTAVESAGSYKTLFYRRTVTGSGSVSGLVNLRDGRVVAVNAPE